MNIFTFYSASAYQLCRARRPDIVSKWLVKMAKHTDKIFSPSRLSLMLVFRKFRQESFMTGALNTGRV